MSIGDVARALSLSTERVRQLDKCLKPIRTANGQRRYDPLLVEAYAEAR